MSQPGAAYGRREVAGRLDQPVQLSGPTRTSDGAGGWIVTHAPFTPPRVFAAVQALRGEERLQAAGAEIAVTHRVLLRWHPQVSEHTRITWGTRVLEVVGPPAEIGRRSLLECLAIERRAEA